MTSARVRFLSSPKLLIIDGSQRERQVCEVHDIWKKASSCAAKQQSLVAMFGPIRVLLHKQNFCPERNVKQLEDMFTSATL